MTRASLKTARLTLRPLTRQDCAPLVAALSDLSLARMLSRVPHPYGAADFDAFLPLAAPGLVFAIDDDQGLAGMIGMDGELGYWLAPRAQGRGYATEAARAVASLHFAQSHAPLIAGHYADNPASAKVLAKLGFVQTGRRDKMCLALGAARPRIDLRLSLDDFCAALPVFASQRLTYRPMLAHDAPPLHRLVSQWQVTRQLGSFPWPADPDFSAMRAQPYQGIGFAWGIFLAGQFIGTVAITAGELGYMIDPVHHRCGYAHEAVTFAMDHANLPRIEAEVWDDNFASLSLLIKCGFAVEQPTTALSKARGKMTGGLRLSWRPA